MFHFKAGAMLAVAALMASGCGDSEPAAPTAAAVAKPQNLYSNGPSTLNVFRTTDGFVFGLPDLQTGLLAWVGLPTDPTQDAGCGNGGNQTLQQVPMQFAGVYQAVNLLAVAQEINIHVYDISTFEDTCFSPFIAAGTVHMVFGDNDVAAAGPGADAFGFTIQGIVTGYPGGEPLRVQGEVRSLISPIDGSFQRVTTRLTLTPAQGQ